MYKKKFWKQAGLALGVCLAVSGTVVQANAVIDCGDYQIEITGVTIKDTTTTVSAPLDVDISNPQNTADVADTDDNDVYTVDTSENEEEHMLALINRERAKHGAAPLQLSTDLSKIAKYRAWELETSFSHTRPNGGEYTDFLGDKNIWSGENIAAGQVDVPSVFQSWMSSSGHRANMLNSHYRKLGFGHWQDENTTYKNFWVQIFTE